MGFVQISKSHFDSLGAVVDGIPASKALGLFIHEYYEKKRGDLVDDGPFHFVLNQVIDVLRLDPPGKIKADHLLPSEPSIVRGLAPNLNKGLEEH